MPNMVTECVCGCGLLCGRYVSVWKGMMVLYSGKYGQLEKTGE